MRRTSVQRAGAVGVERREPEVEGVEGVVEGVRVVSPMDVAREHTQLTNCSGAK